MPITHVFNDEDNKPDTVEPGVYAATIEQATEKVSKSSGNEMLEILWSIDVNGLIVYDYLVFSEKTGFKVDTLLKATGNAPAKGETVELNAGEMSGWRAFIELTIEDDPKYGKKNKVVKYVTSEGQPPELPKKEKQSLPF
jgi:hypothetical protein